MKISKDRTLCTHVGSLPKPKELLDLILRRDAGERVDHAIIDRCVRDAVAQAVQRQTSAGIDIVGNGEMSKITYIAYTWDRLTGFGDRILYGAPEDDCPPPRDLLDYPNYLQPFIPAARTGFPIRRCTDEIRYTGHHLIEKDFADLGAALAGKSPVEAFVNAASPGVVAVQQPNEHYETYEAYLGALGEAMREEYEAIVEAGYVLQIDGPEFALGRHINMKTFADDAEFLRYAEMCMEALNHALRNVPAESLRLHVCWGNYEGPHHHDIALRKIINLVIKAKPMGISFEAANPRHAHEWKVFQEVKLPEDKILLPGVIDSCTNYIEHPELVADRICQFTGIVGRERVIASTDCGFATYAGPTRVDPDICYAKLASLAQGAALASDRLW